MAGVIAINFLTAFVPTVAAADLGSEPGFIDINEVCRAALRNDAAQFPQIGHPFFGVALFVFQGLFLCVTFIDFSATQTEL